MEFNGRKMFEGLPAVLNEEQRKMFDKLDGIKHDIFQGIPYEYSELKNVYGKDVSIQTFYDDEKKKPCKFFGYNYETGNCSFCEYTQEGPEKQMANYVEGHLQIEDFKDGIIYEEVEYKGGQLHGHVLQRYPNGQVKEDAYYKNGLRDQYGYHGLECIDYREDGTPIRKAQYTEGQLDGNYIDYYENGKEREVANYILGQKEGLCKIYDIEGNVTEEFYMDGQKMEKMPTDEELLSASNSFSFDDILASFEDNQFQLNNPNEQPKKLLSEKLADLGEKVQVSVAKDTVDYDKDMRMGELLKNVNVPPKQPVVFQGRQISQPPAPPKVKDPNKAPLPPQVFLAGKGGR